MISDLSKIKQMRQRLGLTQAQLSHLTGISQSTITKIERGKLDPSYNIAKKIFQTLERQLQLKQKTTIARDMYSKKIITIQPDSTIIDTIKKMEKYAISQLPVTKNDIFVGSISEETIVRKFEKIKNKETKIENIMDEPFPTMPEITPINLIIDVLKTYNAVIITKNGKTSGIITKANLMKKI